MTALPFLGVAVGLAACGSSPGYSSGGGASSTTTPVPAQSTGALVVSTSSGPLGSYLTADSGRSVYLWEADSAGTSTCTGACASVWPPVTTTGTPQASGGATASDLGTITRSDGSHQVTYAGHPLYYFAKDSAPGQTTGEGSNGFGAKWWLVSPTGSPITSGASVSSSPTASSGGGY